MSEKFRSPESEEREITPIAFARSMEELYSILRARGGLDSSQGFIDAETLIGYIKGFLEGKYESTFITRNEGLRATVIELSKNNREKVKQIKHDISDEDLNKILEILEKKRGQDFAKKRDPNFTKKIDAIKKIGSKSVKVLLVACLWAAAAIDAYAVGEILTDTPAAHELAKKIAYFIQDHPELVGTAYDKNLAAELKQKVGEQNVRSVLWENLDLVKQRNNLPEHQNFINTEGLNLTQKEVISSLSHYPKGFAFNVDSLMSTSKIQTLDNYGMPADTADGWADGNTVDIPKYHAKGKTPEYNLSYIISHEIGHLNDWNHNKLLTIDERLNLYSLIIERVQAEDRFKSSYVEDIKNKDKQKELDFKADEYFGELIRVYFSKDKNKLPKQDQNIIQWLIELTDPGYDSERSIKDLNKYVAGLKHAN